MNLQRLTFPFRRPLSVLALSAVAVLTACGGGGGDAGTPIVTPAQVTGLTVDRVSYGRLSTFTATGVNLTAGATFSATGCAGLAVVAASSSATQQVFTCTPGNAMAVRVAATGSASTEIFSQSFTVPKPQVTLTTSAGVVVVELDPAKVKVTVDNFLAYVNSGYYTNTLFHRIVQGFVVQGGGFTAVSTTALTEPSGKRDPIELEVGKGLSNVKGSIAMARTGVLNSATSQFFINSVDNVTLDTLNGGYAVFGNVVSGLAVIDTLNVVATQNVTTPQGSLANVPVTPVVLQSAVQTL